MKKKKMEVVLRCHSYVSNARNVFFFFFWNEMYPFGFGELVENLLDKTGML